MAKATLLACAECGRPAAQWSGRCTGCGAWGSIGDAVRPASSRTGAARLVAAEDLSAAGEPPARLPTGLSGLDRVLGGGLVPGSVVLLAGEPGIGKSTLLLQAAAGLAAGGHRCLVASGEESAAQVGGRARRLGLGEAGIRYVPGRDLEPVLDVARLERPGVLVVDSIQTVRSDETAGAAGGVAQVRAGADALVGLAKQEDIAVLLVGHVTKDGDVAGPRTLEHAVDAVLAFGGDARSGLRTVAATKNRFGAEGEVAWFEMEASGLREIDPAGRLVEGPGEAGAAVALCLAGRRAVAVEVQGLTVRTESPPRRNVSGLDPRRFGMVAAVLAGAGVPVGGLDLYGAAAGGMRVDDPAADLAVAAALASARFGLAPPRDSAFVGEVSLTGTLRPASGMGLRLAAARAAGVRTVYAPASPDGAHGAIPEGPGPGSDVVLRPVRTLRDALSWARPRNARARGEKGL